MGRQGGLEALLEVTLGSPHRLSWRRQGSGKATVSPRGEVQAAPLLQPRTRGYHAPHPTAHVLLPEQGSLTASQSRALGDPQAPAEGREAPTR